MNDFDQTTNIERELEVTADDWSQAVAFLADHLPLSKSRIKAAMNAGAVWHCRGEQRERLRRAQTELLPGDRLQVFYNEALVHMPLGSLRPVADEGHYSVWHKPAGMLSRGNDWGDRHALERQVYLHFERQREVLPVYRLEREASGLVLLAHDRRAAAALVEHFDTGEAVMRYRVEVRGHCPAEGVIDTPIDGEAVLTRYARREYSEHADVSTLDVWTGSAGQHLICRHLASLGHPVVGDERDGEGGESRGDLCLKAVELSFSCPLSGEQKRYCLD